MPAKHITKTEFLQKVWNFENNPSRWIFLGDKPVIVDFFATWCGPCKMLSPILDELADEYAGKVDFYKIDTEKEAELSDVFGIRSIPTLLFCPVKGNPQKNVGALPKSTLKDIIEKELLKK